MPPRQFRPQLGRERIFYICSLWPDGTGRRNLMRLRSGGPKGRILINGFGSGGHDGVGPIAPWAWSFTLNYRLLVRVLFTSAALGAGVMLAGCNSDEIALATNSKANQPVSPKLVATMAEKDMDLQSPILVRLFKQEAELEVWKQDRSGHFALLEDLSDLPLVGRSWPQGPRRRPSGAGRLLFDHAGPDESAIGLLSCPSTPAIPTPMTARSVIPVRSSWCMAIVRRAAATQ